MPNLAIERLGRLVPVDIRFRLADNRAVEWIDNGTHIGTDTNNAVSGLLTTAHLASLGLRRAHDLALLVDGVDQQRRVDGFLPNLSQVTGRRLNLPQADCWQAQVSEGHLQVVVFMRHVQLGKIARVEVQGHPFAARQPLRKYRVPIADAQTRCRRGAA